MKLTAYLFIFILLIYMGCTERGTDNISDPDLNPDTNTDYLLTINPTEFGFEEQTAQGNFRNAIFINFEATDVWAMYINTDNQLERLSWELNYDNQVPFLLYTDKYQDTSGIRHKAVTGGYLVNENTNFNNIKISVSKTDFNNVLENKFYNQFKILQPVIFGNENIINNYTYIEAIFVGIAPIDVWAIIKTNSNGYKGKVNLARRIDSAKNYYLLPTTYNDSSGTMVNAVKVGLNTQNYLSFSNIEVIIEK
jgi:hypothetical protein